MSKNTWGYAQELVQKYKFLDSILVRLTLNGEKVEGVFCGEPFVQEFVWTGNSYEPYDPLAHSSQYPFPWFMLNFYTFESNRMQVIEGGRDWLERVLEVKRKFAFNEWAFQILYKNNERVGKPHYIISPSKRFDSETREKIHRAIPYNFDDLRIHHKKGPAHQLRWRHDSATIGYALATKIYDRLKTMSSETSQDFLSRFKVARVRDLKANDLCKALIYLDHIEAGTNIDWTDPDHPFIESER